MHHKPKVSAMAEDCLLFSVLLSRSEITFLVCFNFNSKSQKKHKKKREEIDEYLTGFHKLDHRIRYKGTGVKRLPLIGEHGPLRNSLSRGCTQ